MFPSMKAMAVRSLASLGEAKTKAAKKKLRSAIKVMLAAAGVDVSKLGEASAEADEFEEHVLVVWYDLENDALRTFAPTTPKVDETSEKALELLNGSVHPNLLAIPVEDLDASIRVLALLNAAESARTLYGTLVVPNRRRWDDDFPPPERTDIEELWGRWYKYYAGTGTLAPIEAWISKVYAFGTGPLPAVRLPPLPTPPPKKKQQKKKKATAKPKATAKRNAKAKPKATAKPKPKAATKAKKKKAR